MSVHHYRPFDEEENKEYPTTPPPPYEPAQDLSQQQHPPSLGYPSPQQPTLQYGTSVSQQHGTPVHPEISSSNKSRTYNDPAIITLDEMAVPQGFIKKVRGLLLAQLLVIVGMICLFALYRDLNRFARRNMAMFYSAWVIATVLITVIICCEKVKRSFPLNFLMLALFTLTEGYIVGAVSAHYAADELLMVMGIMAAIVAVILLAFQPKINFTMLKGLLFVALIVLLCLGILAMYFHIKVLRLVSAWLAALIYGFYLVFDMQLLVRASKTYSISHVALDLC